MKLIRNIFFSLFICTILIQNRTLAQSKSLKNYIEEIDKEIKKLNDKKSKFDNQVGLTEYTKEIIRNDRINKLEAQKKSLNKFATWSTKQRDEYLNENNNKITFNFKDIKGAVKIPDYINKLNKINEELVEQKKNKFINDFVKFTPEQRKKFISQLDSNTDPGIADLKYIINSDPAYKGALASINDRNVPVNGAAVTPVIAPISRAAVSNGAAKPKGQPKKSVQKQNSQQAGAAPAAASPQPAVAAQTPAAPAPPAPVVPLKNKKTNAEKCLAVDTREHKEDGSVSLETEEEKKQANENCVVGSFTVGNCDANNAISSTCLKRCGGYWKSKGYSDEISASEMKDIIQDFDEKINKESNTEKKSQIIQDKINLINAIIITDDELILTLNLDNHHNDDSRQLAVFSKMDKLTDCKKLFSCYSNWFVPSNSEEKRQRLENLAIELNNAVKKCELIKNVSDELIAGNKNSELKKLKKQSKEIKNINEFSNTMDENLKLNCDSSKSEKENEKIQAFNIRIGGFEEPVVPYKFVATNDNTNAGMLYFINKKGEKKQEKIIFENGRFYNDQVPAWSADLPASNNLMTIEQVHASHLGSDYCDVFTAAQKAANVPAAAPAAAPVAPAAVAVPAEK